MQDAIFIGAPSGTSWPLSIEMVERRLNEQLPSVLCFPPRHGPASDNDYLPFEVVLDGEPRHGSYVDHSHLILSDGPPALWAETIVWFLGLLPAGTPTVAMVEVNPT